MGTGVVALRAAERSELGRPGPVAPRGATAGGCCTGERCGPPDDDCRNQCPEFRPVGVERPAGDRPVVSLVAR